MDCINGIYFIDLVQEVKKVIQQIQLQVDVIVLVVYMGIDNENQCSGIGVGDIVQVNFEFVVIVVGYMYVKIDKVVVNGVIIIELDKYGCVLLCIDLKFE